MVVRQIFKSGLIPSECDWKLIIRNYLQIAFVKASFFVESCIVKLVFKVWFDTY